MIWLIIGIILFFVLLIVIFGYREVVGNLADRVNELEEEREESDDDYDDSYEIDSAMEKHQYSKSNKGEKELKHLSNKLTENKETTEKEWEVPTFLKK